MLHSEYNGNCLCFFPKVPHIISVNSVFSFDMCNPHGITLCLFGEHFFLNRHLLNLLRVGVHDKQLLGKGNESNGITLCPHET